MQIINLVDAPEHLKLLAAWHHNEWGDLNPGQTLEQREQKMQSYLGDQFIPSTYLAIDRHLLGSAAIVENDMDNRKHLSPWLASVYVDQSYRRRGIGSQLVQHVVDIARLQGIRNMYLFTPEQEVFYQRLGWCVLEKTLYRGSQVTVMCLQIGKKEETL